MKSKLIGLLLLFNTVCFGQVPDTDNFSLQDVVNEVAGIDTNSLRAAFTHSVDAKFDVTYKGDKTNLYNFRNYNASFDCNTLTTTFLWYSLYQNGTETDFTATNAAARQALIDYRNNPYPPTALYGDSYKSDATIIVGSKFYNPNNSCELFGDGYYLIQYASLSDPVYHIVDGVVTEILYCPTIPATGYPAYDTSNNTTTINCIGTYNVSWTIINEANPVFGAVILSVYNSSDELLHYEYITGSVTNLVLTSSGTISWTLNDGDYVKVEQYI